MTADNDNYFPSLSFDGHGINGRDVYRSRLATFSRSAMDSDLMAVYGPLFAAAPDLLAACQDALAYVMRAMPPGGYIAADKLREAIAKAKGETK